jgi:hypothetical protein
MDPETEVVANVFVDSHDPDLPSVHVWLGLSTAPQIWIWLREGGPQVQVFSPRLGRLPEHASEWPKSPGS